MFAILQKYDFSSKSQQAILDADIVKVVCDTAKVRFFKQITTSSLTKFYTIPLFAILQKYDFSSKSQPKSAFARSSCGCLRYCKSTIFQANHNRAAAITNNSGVVCDTAKVRFFKQITTLHEQNSTASKLFAILQKYDFSSKSQRVHRPSSTDTSCLRYCKSTIFQANHNDSSGFSISLKVVCDTAKVRFFKQITTGNNRAYRSLSLFAILQKYDFSSKSQPIFKGSLQKKRCLRYCKSTIFQANHNGYV